MPATLPHSPTAFDVCPAALLALIGRPDAPALVDVRLPEDVAADPHVLPTAIRHPHTALPALRARLDGPVVVLCQKGRKLSQGTAAWLRTTGLSARVLTGGTEAWRAHPDAPRVPLASLPDPGTPWVAPRDAAPDTLAAAWLVRRFLDPRATFLFVPEPDLPEVAARFAATPLAPFDTLRTRHGLTLPALGILAAQLSDRSLSALLSGFALTHPVSTARLAAALPVLDALFARARAAEARA